MKMDEGTAMLVVDAMAYGIIAAALGVIAFVASFLVPVELPIAVFAVLTGLPVQGQFLSPANNLVPNSDRGVLAVQLLAAAAWITGVFVLSTVLGPGPLFFGATLVASTTLWWVLGAGSRREAEAEVAANRERTRPAAFRWSKFSSHGRSVVFDCWEAPGRTYAWEFGDSTGADVASPTHRYAEPGSYEVTLTVTGPHGSDAVKRTVNVP